VIRSLVADDARALSSLVQRVHRETYFQADVYDADALARTIEADLRVGMVASNPDGQLHGSVVFQRDHRRERAGYFNLFMVDQEHRGHGLGSAMLRELIERCRARGMTAAYADAVMSDGHSQLAASREGATETAIQFAATFRSLERHARSELARPCRPTVWFLFRFTTREDSRTIYVPAPYTGVVERIYAAAGVPRNVATPETSTLDARTGFRTAMERDYATGTIRVTAVGADFHPAVDAAATELEAVGCAVVELNLPMREPATATVGDDLVDLGFGFGGAIPYPPPSTREEDVLRLQRLGDVPTQTDGLVTISPLGDALRRVVLRDLDEAREGLRRRRRTLSACVTGHRPEASSCVRGMRRWERLYGVPGNCMTVDPLIVSQAHLTRDAATAERVGAALLQAAVRAARDEPLRELIFGGSVPIGEVTAPLHYRVDATPTEDGLKIFEFNGGAPTGFHIQDLINAMVLGAAPRDRPPGQPIPLLPAFIAAVEGVYSSRLDAWPPSVVIALSSNVVSASPRAGRSQEALAALLRAAGWNARVCPPAALRFDGQALRDRFGRAPVDLVIRRYLPGDPDGAAIEAAARAEAVFLVNPECPLDHKALFELVDDPAVPWTRVISGRATVGPDHDEIDLLAFAQAERERLVLKPSNEYGGQGVMLGAATTDPANWNLALDRAIERYAAGDRFVLQERVTPAHRTFLSFSDQPEPLDLFYDRNAFVFGGRFAGYTTRVSRQPVTNVGRGGGMAPILLEA
jgi:GNAT superfamily N-acetyltransferase